MARKRPTSLLVLGILHLTFGTLGLLNVVSDTAMTWAVNRYFPTSQAPTTSQPKTAAPFEIGDVFSAIEHSPYYREMTLSSTVVSGLLSLVLIVGGIGLVRMRPWARTVSLTYAILSILFHSGEIVYNAVFLLPFLDSFLARVADPAILPVITGVVWVCGLGGVLLYFIYPTFVLVWMLRRPIANALRNGGVEVTPIEPYTRPPA